MHTKKENTPVVLRGINKKKREDMKKEALIITTISGFVPQFEMNNVQILQNIGYRVHYASNFQNPHYGSDNHRLNGTGIVCHQVDFVRSPFRIRENLRAYRQLKAILGEVSFDLIHCHTPMGGVLGRLAAESIRKKQIRNNKKEIPIKEKNNSDKPIKVIYTAHGFHFFRGAPLVNWLFYYPIERWLAHITDILITINKEDYVRAQHFRLRKNGKVWKVNGVGIDSKAYQQLSVDCEKKRKELGFTTDEIIFLSVGELTKRKNHQIVIRTLASMKEECKQNKIRYLICGEGPERKKLIRMIQKYGMEQIVILLGYRNDIKELLAISDCFIFPSKQEGLPVAVMEAMAAGKVCICSDIRGNRDLAEPKELVKNQSIKEYQNKIREFLNGSRSEKRNMQPYSISFIKKTMLALYRQ